MLSFDPLGAQGRRIWNRTDRIVHPLPDQADSGRRTLLVGRPTPCAERGRVSELRPEVFPGRMIQLQNNELSTPARSLVPLLRDIENLNSAAQRAAARLPHWNDVLDKDSVEAGIYEMWQRRLIANVRGVVVPKPAQAFLGPPMSRSVI